MADFTVGITIRGYDQATGTIRGVSTELRGLETAARTAGVATGALVGRFDRIGQVSQRVGMQMTAVGGATVAALGIAGREAMEFQATMTDVAIQSGATAAAMESVKAIALADEFEELGKSGVTVAGMFKRLAAEGYGVAEMKAMLKPITETTIALGTDEAETTKLMLNLMEQYKLSASDMPRIGDAMAAALANTSFQGQELADAMNKAGVQGKLLGWSLEETIAVTDRVIKTTGQASMAGRYFRSTMSSLMGPSKELTAMFASVGISAKDLAEAIKDPIATIELLTLAHERGANFAEGFSNVAMAAAGALVGEADAVRQVEASLHDVGAAHDAATRKMEDTAGQAAIVEAKFANLRQQIGTLLLPVFDDLAELLGPLLDDLEGLMEHDLAAPFVLAAGGGGALLLVLGPLAMAVGGLLQTWSLVTLAAQGAATAELAAGSAATAASATITASTGRAAAGWRMVTAAAGGAATAQTTAGAAAAGAATKTASASAGLVGAAALVANAVDDAHKRMIEGAQRSENAWVRLYGQVERFARLFAFVLGPGGIGISMKDWTEVMREAWAAMKDGEDFGEALSDAIMGVENATEDVTEATEADTEAKRKAADAAKEQADEAEKLAAAQESLRDATKDLLGIQREAQGLVGESVEEGQEDISAKVQRLWDLQEAERRRGLSKEEQALLRAQDRKREIVQAEQDLEQAKRNAVENTASVIAEQHQRIQKAWMQQLEAAKQAAGGIRAAEAAISQERERQADVYEQTALRINRARRAAGELIGEYVLPSHPATMGIGTPAGGASVGGAGAGAALASGAGAGAGAGAAAIAGSAMAAGMGAAQAEVGRTAVGTQRPAVNLYIEGNLYGDSEFERMVEQAVGGMLRNSVLAAG